ncbi:hypothetical protein NDU88_004000 [Pleurodeles waltl]|uniref:Uncharacterized protein n=1 Tax=Pleurodeles waltl TaxID=8319 RepID=A0AAV7SHI6_PLEWA|nr:hypothetical protein NDU88_004000 [Pleurodeles waltl]
MLPQAVVRLTRMSGKKGCAVAEMTRDVSVPVVGGRPQGKQKKEVRLTRMSGKKGCAVAEMTRDVSVPIVGGRPQGKQKKESATKWKIKRGTKRYINTNSVPSSSSTSPKHCQVCPKKQIVIVSESVRYN